MKWISIGIIHANIIIVVTVVVVAVVFVVVVIGVLVVVIVVVVVIPVVNVVIFFSTTDSICRFLLQSLPFSMRLRISARGRACPSVKLFSNEVFE